MCRLLQVHLNLLRILSCSFDIIVQNDVALYCGSALGYSISFQIYSDNFYIVFPCLWRKIKCQILSKIQKQACVYLYIGIAWDAWNIINSSMPPLEKTYSQLCVSQYFILCSFFSFYLPISNRFVQTKTKPTQWNIKHLSTHKNTNRLTAINIWGRLLF